MEYKPIPSAPGYFAGADGSIVGKRGYTLSQASNPGGYRNFRVRRPGLSVAATVSSHVAICEAWHGPKPEGKEVAHLNGIKDDNRPENLAWKTRRENMADKRRHGTQPEGEQIWRAKLTDEIVRAIRQSTESHAALARRYGVSTPAIFRARNRQTWRHVE